MLTSSQTQEEKNKFETLLDSLVTLCKQLSRPEVVPEKELTKIYRNFEIAYRSAYPGPRRPPSYAQLIEYAIRTQNEFPREIKFRNTETVYFLLDNCPQLLKSFLELSGPEQENNTALLDQVKIQRLQNVVDRYEFAQLPLLLVSEPSLKVKTYFSQIMFPEDSLPYLGTQLQKMPVLLAHIWTASTQVQSAIKHDEHLKSRLVVILESGVHGSHESRFHYFCSQTLHLCLNSLKPDHVLEECAKPIANTPVLPVHNCLIRKSPTRVRGKGTYQNFTPRKLPSISEESWDEVEQENEPG